MEEQTFTLCMRQAGPYQYDVTRPESSATQTAETLENALMIAMHARFKYLSTRSLIPVFPDQHVDKNGGAFLTSKKTRTLIWSTKLF